MLAAPVVQPRQARADAGYPLDTSDTEVEDAVDYLLNEQGSDGNIGSFATSAWAVMALAAAEEEDAVGELIDYLEDEADLNSSSSATDWARMILAICAAGEDPTDFGGEDYVDGLLDTREDDGDYLQIGDTELLNDDIWAIIALKAANESIPADVVDFVIAYQNDDGGWGIDINSDSDVDVTAAGIMALVAAEADADAEIDDALAFLRDSRNDDGGFPENPGDESNAASDAWAILAIRAAGEDPDGTDWDYGGTPVEHLLSLQDEDGFFCETDGDSATPEWMTCYAIPALLGEPYPVPPAESSSGGDGSIETSPTSLKFYATEDGGDPIDRKLRILNDGDGDIDWEVEAVEAWLDVSPSSGSSDDEGDDVTVSVDIDGLVADEYHGTITITSDDADNSPETVSVTLYVEEPADDDEIAFYPDEFEFAFDLDDDIDPEDQVLEIWNAYPGSSAEWEIDVDCDDGWLSVSPDAGDLEDEHVSVRLRVDIEDLDADDYDATIIITSDDADNSPVEIDVTLEVTGEVEDEKEIGYSPSRFSFEAVVDGDDPDPQILEISNDGDGKLYWVVSADEDWLDLSPSSGSSSGETDEVDVYVDISGLEEGQYTADITIEDDDDDDNSATVRVTLVLEEEEEEEEETPDTYILAASVAPAGAGTISRSVQPNASGYYPLDTTITLTATPTEGYAFVGWTGDAGGSVPTATVVMSNHRSVVATFLRFDASGLTNVKLSYAPPEMTGLTVIPYPVESIPTSPDGFRLLSAYVVQPEGSGTFALEFTGVTDADNVAVFQVVNGQWAQVPRTVLGGTTLQFSLPVTDAVLALASPGSSSSVSALWDKFKGAFSTIDDTTLIIVGVVGAVLVGAVVVLLLVRRQRQSY